MVMFFGFGPAAAEPNGEGQSLNGSAPSPEKDFHRATTEAERALDQIIRLSDQDDGLFLFVTRRPERDERRDRKYASLLTAKLKRTILAEERRMVKQDCGGVYTGEICGFNSDPITCAQDYSEDGYIYRTEQATNDMAIVFLRWPHLPDDVANYRMIRSGNRWILDGVACATGAKFNMK
jgi:hypothetical protein